MQTFGLQPLAPIQSSCRYAALKKDLHDPRVIEADDCQVGRPGVATTTPRSRKEFQKLEYAREKIEAFKSGIAANDPPRNSVYGVCFVLPQVARSLDWPPSLVGKVLQAYVVLGICWFMQIAFIDEIYKIEKMRSTKCESAWQNHNATGPSLCEQKGYVRVDERNPPDYTRWHLCGAGLPYNTRMLCIAVFIVYIFRDIREILELLRCLSDTPTSNDSWVSVKFNKDSSLNPNGEPMAGLDSELKFVINGQPLAWKAVNSFIMVVKVIISALLIVYGTSFLFNESDRIELILNSIAFCFIIDIDEMLFSACATQDVREKMDNLVTFTDTLDRIVLTDDSESDGSDIEGAPGMIPIAHQAVPMARLLRVDKRGTSYVGPILHSFVLPVVIVICLLASFGYYASYCPAMTDEW